MKVYYFHRKHGPHRGTSFLHTISFPGLMIEHMIKVAYIRVGKHGLPYGFFLTRVFEHFHVSLVKAIVGTGKQMFTMSTLEECECVLKKGGGGNNLTISNLIEAPETTTLEIKWLQAENAILKSKLTQKSTEPGFSDPL